MKKTEKDLMSDVMIPNTAIFPNILIPPSSNNQYKLFNRGGRMYHVPSNELKIFQDIMDKYKYICPNFLENKHKIEQWVNQNLYLEIRSVFYFKHKRLFSKVGKLKRLDVSNRIKALHDSLSTLLGLDDSIFFRVFAEKLPCRNDLVEHCCVEITPVRIVSAATEDH